MSRLYDKKEWGIQQSVWWQRNSRNKWITKLALLVILSGYQRTLDHNFSICIQCSHTPSKQFCNLFVLLPFVSNFSTDWKWATQGVWKSHKKSHSTLWAKRAMLTIWLKMLKVVNLASFWKPEACGETVLPDRSNSIRQKLVENAKIQMRHFESFLNIVYFKYASLSRPSASLAPL